MLHEEITSEIIAAFYAVYNVLGYGFLEKVYENALIFELKKRGFIVKQQVPIQVYYGGQVVGEYFADLLVQDKVILELKTADEISDAHEAQLINLGSLVVCVVPPIYWGSPMDEKTGSFCSPNRF